MTHALRFRPVLVHALLNGGLWLGAAHAADAPNSSVGVLLDQVTITDTAADNSTLTVGERTRKEIDARQGHIVDTARLIDDIPGVQLYGSGQVSGIPVVRGLNDDRVRTEVNGMSLPSACANHMNPPLSYVDRTSVGKVTVLTGITPVSRGGDSIGGAVIVEPPDPVFAAEGQGVLVQGRASSFFRSNGDAFGGSIAAGVASQRARLDYTGSHSQSRNYFDGNGQEVKSSAYESQNHAAALSFNLDNHQLVIRGGQQHIPFQNYPNARMDMTGNDSTFGNIQHKAEFDWGRMDNRFFFEHTEHSMNMGEDRQVGAFAPPNDRMPMESRGRNVGYRTQLEIPFTERDTVRVGNEFHSSRIRDFWPPVHTDRLGPGDGMYWMMAPQSSVVLNDAERDRVGTFAEWEARWTDRWSSQLGVRHDHVNTDTGNVQPYNPDLLGEGAGHAGHGGAHAGHGGATESLVAAERFNARSHARENDLIDLTALLRYSPDLLSDYEFGYARKNRAPNLYERYTWGVRPMEMAMIGWFGDGNGYTGNLDLKPETAHHVSFTAAFHDAAKEVWEVKLTPYFTYVQNFIDADRCPTRLGGAACTQENLVREKDFVFLQYANHDAQLYGVDASGRARLYRDSRLGEFTADTGMSWVRGERRDGDNLYRMMPFNSRLGLNHVRGGWHSTMEMQFVDGKKDVQAVRNETTTTGYFLLNARTGYNFGKVRVDLGLDNLLDKHYFHPLQGAYLGDRYGMNPLDTTSPAWGRNVAGLGRSFFIGVTAEY